MTENNQEALAMEGQFQKTHQALNDVLLHIRSSIEANVAGTPWYQEMLRSSESLKALQVLRDNNIQYTLPIAKQFSVKSLSEQVELLKQYRFLPSKDGFRSSTSQKPFDHCHRCRQTYDGKRICAIYFEVETSPYTAANLSFVMCSAHLDCLPEELKILIH